MKKADSINKRLQYDTMTFNIRSLFIIMTLCETINFIVCDSDFVHSRIKAHCSKINGHSSTCQKIIQCDYIVNKIKSKGTITSEVQNFVRNNTCGYADSVPKVCCPVPSLHTRRKKNKSLTQSQKSKLLPAKCGQVFIKNRIMGGSQTELDEFPWLALLEYENRKKIILDCGGALITKRYVLTAAHCIQSIPSTWKLRNVRLGENDVRTNPDCMDEGDGELTCAKKVLIVPIERQIAHENFMKPQKFRNDIGLLRLKKDIKFTRYIQPICLPTTDVTSKFYWVAGWGRTEYLIRSNVKLTVRIPLVNASECTRVYNSEGIYLDKTQMCAGGIEEHDTCKGDSGGPLMKQMRINDMSNSWVVDGVVSLGHNPCASQGWPAIYTKVYEHIPWILNKISH